MILLLGGSGYVGNAFRTLFDRRAIEYRSVSRQSCDYTNHQALIELIRESNASFLINAAGYTGKPNVDACEFHKADCLFGNAVLPGIIAKACAACDLSWGHVSSGCIYTGTRPDGKGFREEDPPNFCFRTNNCSFYSGCKALGEECLADQDNVYIWRLRVPFNHVDSQRNYLSKLVRYERLLDATNSISHLDEFAEACLACWQRRVPTGIYNVTNGGAMSTRQIVELIQRYRPMDKEFLFFESEQQFMKMAAITPRSNCVMDNSKLLACGIQMSPVEDAIIQSLEHWQC